MEACCTCSSWPRHTGNAAGIQVKLTRIVGANGSEFAQLEIKTVDVLLPCWGAHVRPGCRQLALGIAGSLSGGEAFWWQLQRAGMAI